MTENRYLHELSILAQQQLNRKQWSSAQLTLEALLHHRPLNTDFLWGLSQAYFYQNKQDDCKHLLITLLKQNPTHIKALRCLYQLYRQNKQFLSAEKVLQDWFTYYPTSGEPHYELGCLYLEQFRYAEAISSFKCAESLTPDALFIYEKLAQSYRGSFQVELAEKIYRRLLSLSPEHIGSMVNLAAVLAIIGDYQGAKEILLEAAKIAPKHAKILLNLAYLELQQGVFPGAWDYFPLLRMIGNNRPLRLPQGAKPWDGSIRPDQKLAIVQENGLGDLINMSRFFRRLLEMGQPIVICPLEPIWQRLFSTIEGVSVLNPLEWVDKPIAQYYLADSDLPLQFQWCSENALQDSHPYLYVDKHLEIPLGNCGGRRIGLVWASGSRTMSPILYWSYRQRSAGLDVFQLMVKACPEISFYSLQVGPDAQQLSDYPDLQITDLAPFIKDMYDTAAYIMQMDLVITVDTAVAHLAGALGKPVWILLPKACDWRWGHEGETTPWYPSVRLFRQSEFLQWESVIQSVIDELPKFLNSLSGIDLV